MKTLVLMVAALAGLGAGGEKVVWEKKPETALAVAAATGKPICWYFLTGETIKGKETAGC